MRVQRLRPQDGFVDQLIGHGQLVRQAGGQRFGRVEQMRRQGQPPSPYRVQPVIENRLRHRGKGQARLRLGQADLVISLRSDHPIAGQHHDPAGTDRIAIDRAHRSAGQSVQRRGKFIDRGNRPLLTRLVERSRHFRVHAAGKMRTGSGQHDTALWRFLGQRLERRCTFLQ